MIFKKENIVFFQEFYLSSLDLENVQNFFIAEKLWTIELASKVLIQI